MYYRFLTILSVFSLVFLFVSCNTNPVNPPAEGFNMEGSDPKAIEIADAVMEASGGRKAWDNTNYLQWRFYYGERLHVWNKGTGDIIITSEKDTFEIRMNVESMEGSVMWKGNNLTKADSLDTYLQKGKEMWINDAYWMFLPYKLKDTGVTLKYLGESTVPEGEDAEKIELTFVGVGVTPDNKYHVYVDKETNLVSHWDYFANYQDTVPRISVPWTDYQQYGDLLLSVSRGGQRIMKDIAVGEELATKFQ